MSEDGEIEKNSLDDMRIIDQSELRIGDGGSAFTDRFNYKVGATWIGVVNLASGQDYNFLLQFLFVF